MHSKDRSAENADRGEVDDGLAIPAHPLIPGLPSITPAMLTMVDLDKEQIDRIVSTVPGGAANVQDIYPLSSLQEGMLFHRLMNESSDSYVLSAQFELDDLQWLREFIEALQCVVDRHDVLRTAVFWAGLPRPVQVVHCRAVVPVMEIALSAGVDPTAELESYLLPQRQALNLNCAPLGRVVIAKGQSGSRWHALLQVHHIVCDHQGLRMILKEVSDSLHSGESRSGRVRAYREYVAEALNLSGNDEATNFFRSRLSDLQESTMPFGLASSRRDMNPVDEEAQVMDRILAARVRAEAKRAGVSAARVIHAAWALVVASTSGRDDVVFGTVLLAKRGGRLTAPSTIGMSVNSLPIRLKLVGLTATELLNEVDQELHQLGMYVHTPLTVAQAFSGLSKGQLFSYLLNYRHSEELPVEEEPLGVRLVRTGEAWTNYPIVLIVDDTKREFVLTVQTEPSIAAKQIISYVAKALESLVSALEHSPAVPALSLSVVPRHEMELVLSTFASAPSRRPEKWLVHELFEEQVTRRRGAIAVTCEGHSLSYAELNAKANQLAHYLRERGVGPDDLVALLLGRSSDLLVATLATLKAGGAYLPLDPAQPTERTDYMLRNAAPKVLLTVQHLRSRVADGLGDVISLDEEWSEIGSRASENIDRSIVGLHARHLAYVIYTSGSTGTPKGVMVEHGGLVNYLSWALQMYPIEADTVSAVHSPLAFDATVTSVFCPLLSGASVVLLSEGMEMEGLEELLEGATRWGLIKITPAHLRGLGERVSTSSSDAKLGGTIVIGGDALSPNTVELWRSILSDVRLVNEYGPTETVVGCSAYELPAGVNLSSSVPIGRPIQNTQIYILDDRRGLAPLGVIGGIYVGGAGVARGYLNRPDITAERFIANPFSDIPGSRLYMTGDLGKWRADGTIEYCGRSDGQVKIRGFRVELGEIGEHLLRHPQITAAVVTAREDDGGDKRLVAYLVPENMSSPPSAEQIRMHLRVSLPPYMIPDRCVLIERMPLTTNGKVDRRALPVPDAAFDAGFENNPPQGELENLVAKVWETLLSVTRVGRASDFFALGGHSLLAMRVTARLQSELSIDLPARSIFDFPTVEQLAGRIDEMLNEQLLDGIEGQGEEAKLMIQRLADMSDEGVEILLSELRTEARS